MDKRVVKYMNCRRLIAIAFIKVAKVQNLIIIIATQNRVAISKKVPRNYIDRTLKDKIMGILSSFL